MFSTNLRAGMLGIPALFCICFCRLALMPAFGANLIPEATAPSSAQEREAVAEKFVERELQVWQGRMQLQDWKIRIHLVRSDMLEPRTLGNVKWDTDSKEATIGVLSSYDYPLPFDAMLDDMEVTVVHELVHLELAAIPHSPASRSQEEHAVVALTHALLSMVK
jgi:hypothetical protein